MKVTLRWLQEFAPFDQSIDALGDTMSDLGMAVEDRWTVGDGLDGVVVAEVVSLRPHPDADRIQLVDVDPGDGRALQIACGAFNMSVGDRVPLATVGTVMANGMEIAARKMRGEMSNGMLCSATELGLGADADGIMILDRHDPGTPLAEALGIESDVVWDLEVNANRPDAMSVAGVARDLAARLDVPFRIPDPTVVETGSPAGDLISVEIVDPVLCGRFLARALGGVTVGPGPAWMARRLEAIGMRSINSIVDVSNYVMAELGQPNHTYDLASVAGSTLRVRRARPGETLRTLDGVERALIEADGVIADGDDAAIGLAGVMGGASTEITGTTTEVLLEMAWWRPEDIARTSTRLQLRSEASLRFERGTDPEGVERAARRFCELLAASGATVSPGVVDESGTMPEREAIRVRPDKVNQVLGTELHTDEMASILRSIEFGVEPGETSGELEVSAPSFRPDTTVEIDVIEEIARHHGYSEIDRTVPRSAHSGGLSPMHRLKRRVQDTLVGAGLDEAMPFPFLGPGDLERIGLPADAIELTNPLVSEESLMRTSLRPGLLAAVAHNERHRQTGIGLFEIGCIFQPAPDDRLPHQPEVLGVVRAGDGVAAVVDVWGILAEALRLPDPRMANEPVSGLHAGRSGRLMSGEATVGDIGEVPAAVCRAVGIEQPGVAWLGLDLEAVLGLGRPVPTYRPVSRHPSSDIDLAFDVSESVPAAEVDRLLRDAGGDLLVDLWLFDVFRGPPIGDGRRSLAYGLRFQAPDRTLATDDVATLRQRCIDAVQSGLDARIRT